MWGEFIGPGELYSEIEVGLVEEPDQPHRRRHRGAIEIRGDFERDLFLAPKIQKEFARFYGIAAKPMEKVLSAQDAGLIT